MEIKITHIALYRGTSNKYSMAAWLNCDGVRQKQQHKEL